MLRTSYLIVIFELRLTRILTLPNIQKKLKYYMWESVEKKERRKKRTGVFRSYRISHREVLPVKSQTCQNYWWTSQKPFLQVMLLICFSSTCKKKRFWHSAWCYLNVLVNIITQCYPHYFTEIQATGAPVHTIYQGWVLCDSIDAKHFQQ